MNKMNENINIYLYQNISDSKAIILLIFSFKVDFTIGLLIF